VLLNKFHFNSCIALGRNSTLKYSTLLLLQEVQTDNNQCQPTICPKGDAVMASSGNLASVEDVAWGIREKRCNDPRLIVLMADDDEDDYILVKTAFEANPIEVDLRWVEDGQEAMDYLLHMGKYMAHETSPRPDLILLDLIMPRKDGLETLKEIKGHPYLKEIPVVLLTSSTRQESMSCGLKLGADSFIIKPCGLDEMINIMGSLREYYFGIVSLPEKISCSIAFAGTRGSPNSESLRRVRCLRLNSRAPDRKGWVH
jgi:DNA-binding response OmpR family regulator